MYLDRRKMMDGLGLGFVVSATIGFMAWAIACAACVAISKHDRDVTQYLFEDLEGEE